MPQKRDTSLISLALLAALATGFHPFTTFLASHPALAQTASPTFTLPEVLPENTRVRIDGSNSMTAINQVLKQKFETQYPGTSVSLATSGTAEALAALNQGKIDLAAIGRALTPAEKAQGLVAVPVTRRKIAMIVGATNPFKGSLTDDQFAKIFRGEITDWAQVGGPAVKIRFIDRPASSDTRQALQNYPVFQKGKFATGANATTLDADNTDAVIAALGTDGISYAIVDQVVIQQSAVRIVPMHKTLPTDARYPFSQPYTYVYKGTPAPGIAAWLGLGTTASNQQVVETALTQAIVAGAPANPPSPAEAPGSEAPADPTPAATPSPAAPVSPSPATATDTTQAGFTWWWLLPLALLVPLIWWALRKRGTTPAATADSPAPESPAATAPATSPIATAPTTPQEPAIATPEVEPTVTEVPTAELGQIDGTALVGGALAAGAGTAALGAVAGSTPEASSRITLTPRDEHQALADWDAPAAHRAQIRQQGGQNFILRLCDVTGLNPDSEPPHQVWEFDVDEDVFNRNVPLMATERDYVAEIGYLGADRQWFLMARSNPARVTTAPVEVTGASPGFSSGAAAGAALLGTAGATALASLGDTDDQTTIEASKYDVGQTDLSTEALATVDEGLPGLPEGYGESRIVLMPRDPQWGYVYWDIPGSHKEELRRQGGERLALRLYDVTDVNLNQQAPHSLQQYDCEELARDWYLPIPVSDRDYIVEIGYLAGDGRWLLLARSNSVRIPPVYPSDWFEDQFISVGWDQDLRGQTLIDLVPPSKRTAASDSPIHDQIFGLAQSTEALRVAGSLFGSMQQVPASIQHLPEQAISSYVFPSGIGMGVAPGVPTFSGLNMSGLTMSGVGFFPSMPPIRARKFWLLADAELIIYGATEPDATVTIAGRPVKLNSDGTFRFQMSFQDGQLSFPILAVAADGEQTRSIHMRFNRETPYRNTNSKDEAQDETY